MKQKTAFKYMFVALIAAAIASVFLVREASATGNSHHNDDVDVDQEQSQTQDQDQEQSQTQDQTNDQSQANDQTINFNGPDELKTTGRAYVSSGDATADCQKFGGISSGWVGHAVGLGINWTDKECRQLQIYDRLVDRGLIKVADATLCRTKTLRKVYGKGNAGQCETELETAYRASQGDGSVEVQDEIDDLRRMVQELSEKSRQATPASPGDDVPYSRYEGEPGDTAVLERAKDCAPCQDCEAEATRAFKACVTK